MSIDYEWISPFGEGGAFDLFFVTEKQKLAHNIDAGSITILRVFCSC